MVWIGGFPYALYKNKFKSPSHPSKPSIPGYLEQWVVLYREAPVFQDALGLRKELPPSSEVLTLPTTN